jgi:hypothetical protein
VLPFPSLSSDSEQEYFTDATTEDLTTDLSRIAGCFVMTGLGHRQRGRQRQVCRVRLSDAVPATAAAVTAMVSGAADPRKARFPTTPALAGGRRGCSAL